MVDKILKEVLIELNKGIPSSIYNLDIKDIMAWKIRKAIELTKKLTAKAIFDDIDRGHIIHTTEYKEIKKQWGLM